MARLVTPQLAMLPDSPLGSWAGEVCLVSLVSYVVRRFLEKPETCTHLSTMVMCPRSFVTSFALTVSNHWLSSSLRKRSIVVLTGAGETPIAGRRWNRFVGHQEAPQTRSAGKRSHRPLRKF